MTQITNFSPLLLAPTRELNIERLRLKTIVKIVSSKGGDMELVKKSKKDSRSISSELGS